MTHSIPQGHSRNTHNLTARFTWLGAFGGACILVGYALSGQAIDDATLAPPLMTGANLSVLHAAIPARAGATEFTPSF